MDAALEIQLLEEFPQLFRGSHESSMQRGFECGDGWFELIYKLAQDIESVARENGLSPDSQEWPQCRQVKSKMGSLRFVVFAVKGYEDMNERISELRNVVLNQSFQIPECCNKSDIANTL